MGYNIKKHDEIVNSEPTVGRWYCGFYFDEDSGEYSSGPLGQYEGSGEFYEGYDEVDMRDCDFLVEQA